MMMSHCPLTVSYSLTWITWEPGGTEPPSSSPPSINNWKNPCGSELIMRSNSGLDWPSCCKRGCKRLGLLCTSCRNCWKWGVLRSCEKSTLPVPDCCCCCCCCWAACWAARKRFWLASRYITSNVSYNHWIKHYIHTVATSLGAIRGCSSCCWCLGGIWCSILLLLLLLLWMCLFSLLLGQKILGNALSSQYAH